jgi:iron-sulfur cluster repair protein YtfE (RIC family)
MEQQALANFTSELRGTLGWIHPSPDLSRRVQSLLFVAQAFQRHLKHLMTLEEEDYKSLVSESAPSLSPLIEELQNEHRQIQKRLRQIMTRLRRIPPNDCETFAKISDDFTAVLEDLDRHNAKELALLEAALLPENNARHE